MIPAQFEYAAPTSVDEALQLLQAHGANAKLLAGGHSLLPLMKLRLATPGWLIDLRRIDGLRYIREDGNELAIGALTTHWMIESSEVVRGCVPLLAEAAGQIGDLQVRNMGTLGGSLAHADPAADYPAAVLALEARVIVEGPRGRRTIPATEFFTGMLTTALSPDEILVEVRVPVPPPRAGSAYLKFPHPASGFAVVGVGAIVTLDRAERCEQARIGVTGAAPVAYRAKEAEDVLAGRPLDAQTIAAAAEKAAQGVDLNEDTFATAAYRRHLAGVYTRRAVHEAANRAKGA